jgi:hypothetical protein
LKTRTGRKRKLKEIVKRDEEKARPKPQELGSGFSTTAPIAQRAALVRWAIGISLSVYLLQ